MNTTPLNFSQNSKIIGDSGASGNFFNIKSIKHLDQVKRHTSPNQSISVTMPDGRKLVSTHSGFLRINNLSKSAKRVYLFPGLQGSLLAFGPLCDDGCTVTLNKTILEIRKNDDIILTGSRTGPTGLWYVDLTSAVTATASPTANATAGTPSAAPTVTTAATTHSVTKIPIVSPVPAANPSVTTVNKSENLPIVSAFSATRSCAAATPHNHQNSKNRKKLATKCDFCSCHQPHPSESPDLFANTSTHFLPREISKRVLQKANYFRYALNAAPITSICTAAKRNYFSFPDITFDHFKQLPPVPATDRGHMKRLRQHLDSTKSSDSMDFYDFNDQLPSNVTDTPRPRNILVGLAPFQERVHLDATGAYIYSNGSKTYDLVFFDEDSNYIHVEQLRGLSSTDYAVAIQDGIDFYRSKRFNIKVFRMDNQTSELVTALIKTTNQLDIELVPSYSHRALRAERAIGTWKNHKISGLASVDPNCPDEAFKHMNWQCELTINLLRPSGLSIHMSAYQAVHGYYDFSRHPIAPLGIKVEMFIPRAIRESSSWGEHSLAGFYIGPSMLHHRGYKAFIPSKNSVRTSDTVNWYPTKDMIMPGSSPILDLTDAINHLSHSLVTFKNLTVQPTDTTILDKLLSSVADFSKSFVPPSAHDTGPLDTPVEESSTPTIEPVSISSFEHPASHDSPYNLRSRRSKYPEFTIIDHKGKKKSQINPLLFRVKFNDGTKKQMWLDLDSVAKTSAFNKYIETRHNLWKILHEDIKIATVTQENTVPPPTDPFWNNVVDTIFQHRRCKDMAFDYDIQVRYKANNSLPGSVKWITLSGPNDPLTSEPAFLKYLNKTNDIYFIERYIDSSFESKFLYVNSVAGAQLAPNEEDHHGLKYLDKGKPLRYDKAILGNEKDEWIAANSDEFDRLFLRTKTMKIIHASDKEKGRIVSYYNPQLTKKIKNKKVLFRVRGTVGGNINDFTGNSTAYTASLPSVKILLNGVISDPNAKFMTIDAKDFFLHGSSGRKEYMRIPLKYFSDKDMEKYNVNNFIKEGDKSVLVEISGNMYGLVNAAHVAQKDIVKLLNANGFIETNTPQLYKHKTKNIQFSLVVDDFGVKYTDKADAEFLIKAIETEYEVSVDWDGKLYLGMNIDIDRTKDIHTLTLSMPGYLRRILQRLDLGPYKSNVNSPMTYNSFHYGQKETTVTEDTSPLIDDARISILKRGIGALLYFTRAVGYDKHTTVSKLASRQAKPTEQVWKEFLHLLNYCNTWPETKLVFKASDMILLLDADASLGSESSFRSRGGGVAWFGKRNDPSFVNGPIDVMSVILPTVPASICEAEYASAFLLAQLAMPFRVQLKDLGYPQDIFPNGSTLLTTDNQCAEGIATNSTKLKRSRAMDMRYHWLRDRVSQGDYTVKWRSNKESLADFFTKTHPTKHFMENRSKFVVYGLRQIPNLP